MSIFGVVLIFVFLVTPVSVFVMGITRKIYLDCFETHAYILGVTLGAPIMTFLGFCVRCQSLNFGKVFVAFLLASLQLITTFVVRGLTDFLEDSKTNEQK